MEIKVIILDGLGLNLKTSTLEYFKDRSVQVVSDSIFRTGAMIDLFPYCTSYLSRIFSKYLSITQAVDTAEKLGKDLVMIDRGISNLITWHQINEAEIVDRYISHEQDRRLIDSNIVSYVSLEDQFKPKRFFIKTDNDLILQDGLDESKYDTDPHTQMRIDAYYDPQYYRVVQKEFLRRYDLITCGDYQLITLDNSHHDYQSMKKLIIEKIESIL